AGRMRTPVRSGRAHGAAPLLPARRRESRAGTTCRGRPLSTAGLEEAGEPSAPASERSNRPDATAAAPDEPVALELSQTRRKVRQPRDGNDLRDLAAALRDEDAPPSLHAPEDLAQFGLGFMNWIGTRHGTSIADLVMMVKLAATVIPLPAARR